MALELTSAAKRWGEEDADAVAGFLRKFHELEGTAFGTWQPPASFLRAVAIALRLARWKNEGFTPYKAFHTTAESMLPSFCEAYRRRPSEAEALLVVWETRVRSVFIESIAWSANETLSGDVTLSELSEDQLLDVVAELLWAISHR